MVGERERERVGIGVVGIEAEEQGCDLSFAPIPLLCHPSSSALHGIALSCSFRTCFSVYIAFYGIATGCTW